VARIAGIECCGAGAATGICACGLVINKWAGPQAGHAVNIDALVRSPYGRPRSDNCGDLSGQAEQGAAAKGAFRRGAMASAGGPGSASQERCPSVAALQAACMQAICSTNRPHATGWARWLLWFCSHRELGHGFVRGANFARPRPGFVRSANKTSCPSTRGLNVASGSAWLKEAHA
jgi:hypothetical protein